MVLLLERIESRVNRVRSAPSYPERPTESTSFVPRENKLSETNLPTQSSYPSGSVRPSAFLLAWLTRDFAIGTPSCNSTSRFDCVSKGDPHTFAMHAWNKIGSSSGWTCRFPLGKGIIHAFKGCIHDRPSEQSHLHCVGSLHCWRCYLILGSQPRCSVKGRSCSWNRGNTVNLSPHTAMPRRLPHHGTGTWSSRTALERGHSGKQWFAMG